MKICSSFLKNCGLSSSSPDNTRRTSGMRRISALLVTCIIVSGLIASLHNCVISHARNPNQNHDNYIIRTICPFCRLAIDFSSADRADAQYLIGLLSEHSPLPEETFVDISGICPVSPTTRAPPLSFRDIFT